MVMNMSVVLPGARQPTETALFRQKEAGQDGFWRTIRLTPGEREIIKNKPNQRKKPYKSWPKQKRDPIDDSYLQDDAETIYLRQLQNVLEYMKKQTQEENNTVSQSKQASKSVESETKPQQISTANGTHLGYRYRPKCGSSKNLYISTLAPSITSNRLPGETTVPEPPQFRLQTLNTSQKQTKPRFLSARNISASTSSLLQRNRKTATALSARADLRKQPTFTQQAADRLPAQRRRLLTGRSSCRIECGSPCDTDSDLDVDEIRLLSYTAQSQHSTVSSVLSLPAVPTKLRKSPSPVKRDSKATDTSDLLQLQPSRTEPIPRRTRGRTEIQPADKESPTRLLVYVPN